MTPTDKLIEQIAQMLQPSAFRRSSTGAWIYADREHVRASARALAIEIIEVVRRFEAISRSISR